MRYWKTGSDVYIGDPFGDAIELTKEQFDEEMLKRAKIEIRQTRDQLIKDIEWRVNRHYQELELDLTPTEELRPLLEYIQALRDVPQQEGFPNNITWPEVPV